jgi:hypothetical protein
LKNRIRFAASLATLAALATLQACGIYSMSGIATSAKTIQVDPFFNNTDLGPANLGVTFTNKLKEYYQQNSNLRVAAENGELQIEGVITGYTVTPVAPVSSGNIIQPDAAALTRLTITVRANYIDNIEPKNSFKDKSFSFYADFPNTQDLTAVREGLERRIFEQIMLDIFSVTVANW